MFSIDRWNEIFQTLGKNKLRTVLTMFSVFWGIFMLIILQGFGTGLQNAASRGMNGMSQDAVSFYPGRTSMPHKGYKPGRSYQFSMDDYHYLTENVEGFKQSNATYNIWGDNTYTYGRNSYSYRTEGVFPDFKSIRNLEILEGRFVNQRDVEHRTKVIVIGKEVKQELFGKKPCLGEYIQNPMATYKVIGVFDHEWGSSSVYLPIKTGQAVFGAGKQIHNFAMTTNQSDKVQAQVRKYMANKYKFKVEDRQALHVWDRKENVKRFNQTFLAIKIFLFIIGIFTITSGIVGISNIMLIVVKERTKEIGIRKAIGASPWSIIGLVLQEAIFITTMAGYIGIVAGIGSLELIKEFLPPTDFLKEPQVDFPIVMYATAFLILSGLFAGYIPARKASKIRPIVALMED